MPGSLTTPGRPGARADAPEYVAFHHMHGVGTQNRKLSRLNGWPMHTPVNASPRPSRATAHDSGPMWIATTSGSDFSCPCIIGFGSSPSRRGPDSPKAFRSDARSPRFRRVPFVRDVALDPGRATAPRISAPHMLPSAIVTASAPANSGISWLIPTPHTITVYASPWSSPPTTQHSLPGGRYPLPGPDFHRLDRASFAWRTTNPLIFIDPGIGAIRLGLVDASPEDGLERRDEEGGSAARAF